MLGTILSIFLSGLVIGGLARWGVPGPDPMPLWLTFLFGFGGSAVGGTIAAVALHASRDVSSADYFTMVLSSILAAMALIILYRRLVQGRGITGPKAHEFPTRGIGVGRPRARVSSGLRARKAAGSRRSELLRHLDELHDQGVLTDEEYLEQRRRVLREET